MAYLATKNASTLFWRFWATVDDDMKMRIRTEVTQACSSMSDMISRLSAMDLDVRGLHELLTSWLTFDRLPIRHNGDVSATLIKIMEYPPVPAKYFNDEWYAFTDQFRKAVIRSQMEFFEGIPISRRATVMRNMPTRLRVLWSDMPRHLAVKKDQQTAGPHVKDPTPPSAEEMEARMREFLPPSHRARKNTKRR